MSRPPKQSGRGIRAVEQEARTKGEREERDEHIKRANITAAIYAVQDQLATNEEEQKTADKNRRFREWLTIALLIGTVIAAVWGDRIFYLQMVDAAAQGVVVKTQADALVAQLALQQENMNRAYRPRLFAEVIQPTDITITDKGVSAGIEFYFRNEGTFPAEDVSFNSALLPVHVAGAAQNQVCRGALDEQNAIIKQNVSQGLPAVFATIIQNERHPVHYLMRATIPLETLISGHELAGPTLVGCIAYRGADDKKVHYTRVMYMLGKMADGHFVATPSDPQVIPKKQVGVMPGEIGNSQD